MGVEGFIYSDKAKKKKKKVKNTPKKLAVKPSSSTKAASL